MVDSVVYKRLKDRIVSGIHLGRFEAGDRLPSIRQISREMGEDHRRVRKVYRALEREGLVEIRGRSGVYVRAQVDLGEARVAEATRWLSEVVMEGWKRRIAVPDLPGTIARCTSRVRLRVALVESCADAMEALRFELEADFGFQVRTVWLDSLESGSAPSAELADADLVVTTLYHAGDVRAAAAEAGKPFVPVQANPELVSAIDERLEAGDLVVVCVDPSFGERIRHTYAAESGAGHVRILLAEDEEALRQLDRSVPVLFTRAARALLPELDLPLIFPHSPTIAPACARDLAECLVRRNIDRSA